MTEILKRALALTFCAALLSGCGLVAAGTAGGVAATELEEEDDNFDPLERTAVGDELEAAGDVVEQPVEAVAN